MLAAAPQNSAQQIATQRLDAVVALLSRFIEHASFDLDKAWSEIPAGTRQNVLEAWKECVVHAGKVSSSSLEGLAREASDRIYADISKRDTLQIPIERIEASKILKATEPARLKGMIEGVILAELIR